MSKTTAIFDNFFLKYLPRIPRIHQLEIVKLLNKWIQSDSEIEQSELAVRAIRLMISKYNQIHQGGEIISESGLRTVSEITDNIVKFESLITLIRTKFQRKIYRDHLNHMIRTALLSSYIGQLAKLDLNERIRLMIAALFHDVGYPVQEAGEIMNEVRKSVGDGYSLLVFDNQLPRLEGTMFRMTELADATEIDSGHLLKYLQGNDIEHSVVGAFEFLACCEEGSEAAIEIASAICLHSKDIKSEISFDRNSLAVCLLIADELQDWGRPATHPDGSVSTPMEEINTFSGFRMRSRLYCEFEYNDSDFPVLDVIYSKFQNLRRIQFGDCPLDLRIEFPLTRFTPVIPSRAYLIPPKSAFPELTIKRNAEKPWRLNISETELSFKDEDLSEKFDINQEEIESARKILMRFENNPPTAVDEWKITQYGQSSNFLVTKKDKGPIGIEFFIFDGQFHIQINNERLSGHHEPAAPVFGEMIQLNSINDEVFIPPALRVLPTILSLRSIINTGRPVNTYWLKGGRTIPRSIRQRRPLGGFVQESVKDVLFSGFDPVVQEFLQDAVIPSENDPQ